MIIFLNYIIVFSYLTLLIELIIFPVESQGSTFRILKGANINYLEKIILVALNIFVLISFIYPLANLYFKWNLLSTSHWMISIGIILIVFGRWLSMGAMIQLRSDNKILHTDKFFKMTRNPNIDGTITFLVGIWFLMPSIAYFIASILVFIYLKNRSKREEKYLLEIFDKKYIDYKKSTKNSLFI